MRRLLPGPTAELDPFEAYRDQPSHWLRIGMVMSLDGSVTDEAGRSGGLGGAGDLRVFHTLRALADGILVGAATVRTEGYGPHRLPEPLRARRSAVGKPAPAPIIVVSGSLNLDWSSGLFTDAVTPTMVVTCAAAMSSWPRDRTAAQPVVAGDRKVDLADALRQLRTGFGLGQLLCEGGPCLATGLVTAGHADELCLTVAPALIGARRHLNPFGQLAHRLDLALTGIYEEEGALFVRYRPG